MAECLRFCHGEGDCLHPHDIEVLITPVPPYYHGDSADRKVYCCPNCRLPRAFSAIYHRIKWRAWRMKNAANQAS